MIEAKENSVGAWAFLLGVVLAVLLGLSTTLIPIPALKTYSSAIYAILVILGIIVGFKIKVSVKDSQTFMIAGAILVIVSKFGINIMPEIIMVTSRGIERTVQPTRNSINVDAGMLLRRRLSNIFH